MLSGNLQKARIRCIGIVNVDLFIPLFTYIFGQGMLGGYKAIVSIYRLRSEFYGIPSDPALLVHRTIKVIIHELGHIPGLYHCHDPACVMRSSTYVEDLDQKSSFFCDECIRKL